MLIIVEGGISVKIIEDVVMKNNTGRSFIVKKGEKIGITSYTIVDTVVLNLQDISERFDQGRTKAHNGVVFISEGDKLYSKKANAMMTITKDTYKGKHDLQFGMCSKIAFDRFWESLQDPNSTISKTWASFNIKRREDLPDHGCWENLQYAFRDYDIAPENIPSPLNLFQSHDITGPRGTIIYNWERDLPPEGHPAYVELKAEIDCVVGLSACPEIIFGKPVEVKVFRD